MKKIIISIFIIFLLISTFNTSYGFNIESDETKNSILCPDIVIPDDYPTIQKGIDEANNYNKIFVKNGVYKENLVIDKKGLILFGEDKYNTILDGCKTDTEGIIVKSEGVTIKGFTIKNFKDSKKEDIHGWNQSGIEIRKPNSIITNNRIIDNGVGIELYDIAYNTTITNNEMINDGFLIGNYFYDFVFPNLTQKSFMHNIYNNTINGKPVYYFKNQNDFTVPTDAGIIVMVNCSNFSIKNIYMSKNDFSIILAFCSNSLIENNTVVDNNGEILFFACENITFQYNTIINTFKGICLEYKSKNNIICYNELSKNYVGISLFACTMNNSIYKNKVFGGHGKFSSGVEIVSYHGGTQKYNNISENIICNNPIGIRFKQNTNENTIYKNNISKNKIGIFIQENSENNKIIKNNIIRNTIQAIFIGCSKNIWNENYWNRPRIIQKTIFGLKKIGLFPVPWVNFDKNPVIHPN